MTDRIFKCECGGCAVEVSADNDALIYLTLWKRVYKPKFNPFSRLAQIICILRDGSPYVGDVVLSADTAMELGIHLAAVGGACKISDERSGQ